MPLMLRNTSPNQDWDTIHTILGKRRSTKQHLPSGKIWAFNYFRDKLAGKKLSAPVNNEVASVANQ